MGLHYNSNYYNSNLTIKSLKCYHMVLSPTSHSQYDHSQAPSTNKAVLSQAIYTSIYHHRQAYVQCLRCRHSLSHTLCQHIYVTRSACQPLSFPLSQSKAQSLSHCSHNPVATPRLDNGLTDHRRTLALLWYSQNPKKLGTNMSTPASFFLVIYVTAPHSQNDWFIPASVPLPATPLHLRYPASQI